MSQPTDGSVTMTGIRTSTIVALVVTSCVASADKDRYGTGWTVSVDTVGGTVHVINTPPTGGTGPTLIGEEELRLGAMEGGGPDSFGFIRSIAVLEDGRIAVADVQAEEIRLFDREGQHLRTFGGEGQGPGELGRMQDVHLDHEGLLRVAEQRNARLSVFHPDSGFVRSFPLRLHSFGFRGPWRAAVDSVGRTIVDSSGQFGEDRFWNMLRIYDPSMNQLDSIPCHDYTDEIDQDEIPGAWKIDLGGGAYTWAAVPFYAYAQQTLSPAGEFWSHTGGEPHLRVARWRPAGDTSLFVVSLRPPEPVTPAERDSAMAAVLEGLSDRVSSPPRLDPSSVPSTKPPTYALSLDERGRLWVRLTDPAMDTTVYDVFGSGGIYAETVRLPFRVDPSIPPTTRGDTLWAVTTDDLEVQYVVRARLRPAAAPEVH